jgi:transposase
MNKTLKSLVARLEKAKAQEIKLGMDVHARNVVVSLQADGSLPMRGMKLESKEVLWLVKQLIAAGMKVSSCYEAGPCGHSLHRELTALGCRNFVVTPTALADGKKQKTDRLDAEALLDRLDRYLRGNSKAFTVNTVPTPEQEQLRSQSRLREQLKESRHQWEARGRSLMLFHGHHVTGKWWTAKRWVVLKGTLPEWLVAELELMRELLLGLDKREKEQRKELEEAAPKDLPVAVGALSWVTLEREVCSWGRFKNRRQVSSYTGLCPGVDQSGGSKRDGHINRHGNPRVRHLLLEMVWRLARWQPDYPPVRKLLESLGKTSSKKKHAVAAARRLAVDLWRLATKQTTAAKIGLRIPPMIAA